MANNYSQATVSPVLPVALVTDFEIVLLNEMDFISKHTYPTVSARPHPRLLRQS